MWLLSTHFRTKHGRETVCIYIGKMFRGLVPNLIDMDQTRFVKNRQTQDNIRWALHLINNLKRNTESEIIILDAKKALDLVRWAYLHLTLNRFGFDSEVIGSLKSLYCSPTGRIKINGNWSKIVSLERGCRQGCPLSPALFIEPLLQAFRVNGDVMGIPNGEDHHKVHTRMISF